MEKIIGLIDAPFTPFYENGEVNASKKWVERCIYQWFIW